MATVCVDTDDFTTDENGRLQIKKGCGLTGTEDGVAADVAEWPHECDQDTHATPVHCSPTTGELQGAPIVRVLRAGQVDNLDLGNNNQQTLQPGDSLCHRVLVPLNLNDWCFDGEAAFQIGGSWDVESQAGGDYIVTVEQRLGGGAFTEEFVAEREFNARNARVRRSFFGPNSFTKTAGSTQNYDVRLCIENNGPGNLIVRRLAPEARGIVVSDNS